MRTRMRRGEGSARGRRSVQGRWVRGVRRCLAPFGALGWGRPAGTIDGAEGRARGGPAAGRMERRMESGHGRAAGGVRRSKPHGSATWRSRLTGRVTGRARTACRPHVRRGRQPYSDRGIFKRLSFGAYRRRLGSAALPRLSDAARPRRNRARRQYAAAASAAALPIRCPSHPRRPARLHEERPMLRVTTKPGGSGYRPTVQI